MTVRTVTLAEFHEELHAQGVSDFTHAALRCPMCGVAQSIASLIKAGASMEEAERKIGFSCVGRLTGAGSPRREPDGLPCNWTLGGLFALHKLEVVTPDGKVHPRFEPATPEEAQALERRNAP